MWSLALLNTSRGSSNGSAMAKTPKKEEIKDEPGAEDRFLRGAKKPMSTPPRPFAKPAKDQGGAKGSD